MQVLLNLLAGVALLVWGTHLVRTGIMRTWGGQLRRVLGTSISNRFHALLAGIGVTGLLQSSTATALITTSFVGQGLIATAPALAIMLGADVGTSLVVQLLSIDLSWLWPLLIFIGVVIHLSRESTTLGVRMDPLAGTRAALSSTARSTVASSQVSPARPATLRAMRWAVCCRSYSLSSASSCARSASAWRLRCATRSLNDCSPCS